MLQVRSTGPPADSSSFAIDSTVLRSSLLAANPLLSPATAFYKQKHHKYKMVLKKYVIKIVILEGIYIGNSTTNTLPQDFKIFSV